MAEIVIVCVPDRTDPLDERRLMASHTSLYSRLVWRPYRFDRGFTAVACVVERNVLQRLSGLESEISGWQTTRMPDL